MTVPRKLTFPKKNGIIQKRTVRKMTYEKSPRKSGKKGVLRLAALLLIPTLAACHYNTPAELPAEPPESDTETSAITTTESTPESTTSTTTKITAKPTTTATTRITTESATTTTTEAAPEAPIPLPEDFQLSDYITDFDEVAFSYCTVIGDSVFPQADEAVIAKAIETYKSSALYTEAIDGLKEIFSYENGELICSAEYTGSDPARAILSKEYITERAYYIDRSAAPEIALKPEVVQSCRAAFDGENEESLILLRTALPMSKQDWSGNYHYHVPVYVNADGEALILHDACRQDHGGFELLSYERYEPIHALFGFGHNQSGQRSALYSFKDGKPKLELSGCPLSVYQGMLLGGFGWVCWEPFLFDGENGAFCAVAAVTPSEELAKIICSDKTVLSYVPDAWEVYQKDWLQIIGGKYITFNTGVPWTDNTFIYNRSGKCFEHLDQPVSVLERDFPEQITKSYNINLGS